MQNILTTSHYRFFSTYSQWETLSPVSKCYVTDLCVPSYDLNKTPIHILHHEYKLCIWIIIACPNELVLKYILKQLPMIRGFIFRSQPLQIPAQLFHFYELTKELKKLLPGTIKIGWAFQWHHYPFSPKHFGWTQKNQLSRPSLPQIETILDICIIQWHPQLKPQEFQTFFKRLTQLGFPSNIVVVPFIPEKPVDLYEKNVMGVTTEHLLNDKLPYFFPLQKPKWLEPPCSKKV